MARAFFESWDQFLHLWGQWYCRRGFVDTHPGATLYQDDGRLNAESLDRLKEILTDAAAVGSVIELAMFARESWDDDIRLSPSGYDKATIALTESLKSFGNVTLQIWNEHDHQRQKSQQHTPPCDGSRGG